MKKTLILASFLALTPFAKGQLLLEALDAPNAFTSTQTRSYSGTFTKNDCAGADYRGTSVTYTQSATVTATSYISQQDADNKAVNEATAEAQRLVNQGGQAYANLNGSCDYYGAKPKCIFVYTHPQNHGGSGNQLDLGINAINYNDCETKCDLAYKGRTNNLGVGLHNLNNYFLACVWDGSIVFRRDWPH